jgi:LuxR family maltose regulon positive regulatory protein
LATLINELSGNCKDIVLVLDDYHLINLPEINEEMIFLLDHLPPLLHLVIASRADPPLPLARSRA